MKKIILALLVISFAVSACVCMAGPPASIYTGQPTKVMTGQVTSVSSFVKSCLRMTVVDDNKNIVIIDIQSGTSDRYYNPNGKRLEITYFVADDGRNVALSTRDLTPVQ